MLPLCNLGPYLLEVELECSLCNLSKSRIDHFILIVIALKLHFICDRYILSLYGGAKVMYLVEDVAWHP